ncbi:MAG: RNA polymerase sigma factor [Kiritimatiellae bacterium]|nr:RNA polymerase sigma factor [Kiritimatiellia bacterium]
MKAPETDAQALDPPFEKPLEMNLEELMNAHAPSLLRYAARMVRDDHAARDVVQQVFIRYHELQPGERPAIGAVRSWLYRVTHNRAVDLIRKEQRRKKLHETHAELDLAEERSQRAAQNRQRTRAVLDHIHLLKENERTVLLLRLQEGLSYREISEVTDLSEGNVGYLLHQAVATLSEKLAQKQAHKQEKAGTS